MVLHKPNILRCKVSFLSPNVCCRCGLPSFQHVNARIHFVGLEMQRIEHCVRVVANFAQVVNAWSVGLGLTAPSVPSVPWGSFLRML